VINLSGSSHYHTATHCLTAAAHVHWKKYLMLPFRREHGTRSWKNLGEIDSATWYEEKKATTKRRATFQDSARTSAHLTSPFAPMPSFHSATPRWRSKKLGFGRPPTTSAIRLRHDLSEPCRVFSLRWASIAAPTHGNMDDCCFSTTPFRVGSASGAGFGPGH
jgi:hypothetical protein